MSGPPVALPVPLRRGARAVRERAGTRSRAARLLTRRRLSVAALLGLTALLYLWDLGASGWANAFYSAAVQAGTRSWTAFLFGSFDASNFITVDKPPAALWVMDLSARLFGVNAWSILVPQALEGVAAVGVLYAAVRRSFGHAAGLIAGAVFALTPVAALMFRFNNPDALLLLLLVASAYALTRALEHGRLRWLLLAGVLVGLGFLTKMLQAFIVLPVFAGVYLLAAPVPPRRRLLHLLGAGLAVVVSAGWFVALVTLWPAADRPYIGGSSDNSLLNLIFGYNGFGRITGNETGSVGGGSGWGPTGLFRLFNASFGGQASWLIPTALLLGGGVLWLRGRAPRVDAKRAAVLLWGGWLLLTGLLFSFAAGIIHPYYTVALAPAIGALVGIGSVELWRRRDRLAARALLSAAVAAAVIWGFVLLDRSPDWLPWLRVAVLAAGGLGAAALLAPPRRPGSEAGAPHRSLLRAPSRALATAAAAVALAAALAGPLAYSLDTAGTPHSGALPSAGPALTSAAGGPQPAAGGVRAPGGGTASVPGVPPAGLAPVGGQAGGTGAVAPGTGPGSRAGSLPARGSISGLAPRIGSRAGAGGAGGGLLQASTPSAALVAALEKDAGAFRWVAATVGSNDAAGYQLATRDPVMAIGGFNGTDPWPTLAVFETLVREGAIHYFIPGGGGQGIAVGGSSESRAITSWVESHFTSSTVGGTTVYDLTAPSGSTGT